MNIITIDFETFYSNEVGFKKHTTEEYVRHEDFEVIGFAIREGDNEATWHTGTHEELAEVLAQYNWKDSFILAHNTAFDGAILSWHFGIKPKGWLDTLSMARSIHGVDAGGSLKALAERYNIGVKGTEVNNALGKKRLDFSAEDLARYGEYCINDVELTRTLFYLFMLPGLGEGFPVKELKVIDATLRMFIEPSLVLDLPLLEQHLEDVKGRKEKLLAAVAADKDALMSNDKFAELLRQLKVDPPRKISPTTGKETYAFAKTDEGLKALMEHPDMRVQALVAARLGNKSTLEETRTQRFIDIAKRGLLPVPLKYYAAHTGRWGGDDKINLQNLPSRGANKNKLKKAIRAPEGYVIIDCDSSQIEARVLAWWAGQDDLVDAFAKGEDIYSQMASEIYGREVNRKRVEVGEDGKEFCPDEREGFVGKTTILGAGYGMGPPKFQAQTLAMGVDLPTALCEKAIATYRATYFKIPELWKQGQRAIDAMVTGAHVNLGREGVVQFDASRQGFLLPSGLWQRYEGIHRVEENGKVQFVYKTRRGMVKMYGGKLIENLCQAIARCIIAEQMIKIGLRYKTVLTVHDAVACIAPKEEAEEARRYVEECMRWTPKWATGLPLNCESGMAESYGEC